MKRAYLYISATGFFTCSSIVAYAQVKAPETIELDALTKIIGVALTIGGFFMGFMQMKMAHKIAEVEAKFSQALNTVEQKFTSIIHSENEKQNDKLKLGLKELENKMVTTHDLNNLKQIIVLQHKNVEIRLDYLQKEKDK